MEAGGLGSHILDKFPVRDILRADHQALLELLGQVCIGGFVGTQVIGLLGHFGADLPIQDKVEECMGIITVWRLGGDKCGIYAKAQSLLGVHHLKIRVLAEGQDHLGGEEEGRAHFSAEQEILGLVLAEHTHIGSQLHQLIPSRTDHIQIFCIKGLSHGL